MQWLIIIYQIIFAAGFIFLSPFFLYAFIRRHKWKKGLRQRFGKYPQESILKNSSQKILWFHAASVGEVGTITDLIQALRKEYPLCYIIITTLTSTGQEMARKKLPDEKYIFYYPFDFAFSVNRAIRMFKPDLFILVEAEIWPLLLYKLQKKSIPTAMVNVRMSERSLRRYHFFRFFIGWFIRRMIFITVPTQDIARQMLLLGAKEACINITGNLKYDKPYFSRPDQTQLENMRMTLGFRLDHMILLCGSTHPGEEEILIRVYQHLRPDFPKIKLIIAPRHPQRSMEIGELLGKNNIPYAFRSKLDVNARKDVLILDTLGELEVFYGVADLVFIGKSLTKKGGQNLMEAARYGKPILFGPHMENFMEMTRVFLKASAAVEIQDEAELILEIRNLMSSNDRRKSLGDKALRIWTQHSGAFDKHIEIIKSHFK